MPQEKKRRGFFDLNCNDILNILCAAAVPIALGIYTAVTYEREEARQQKMQELKMNQTAESRQDKIYDGFLKNIFKLDIDGYLNDSKNPWAFANAYYRAAHRHLEPVRKGDILQFLKEQRLIGRNNCTSVCGYRPIDDIIRLSELSFNKMYLTSQTGTLNYLNLQCVVFEKVLMKQTTFFWNDLHGASFDHARLSNVNFHNSSLVCATFIGTIFENVDFTGSNLTGAIFIDVDLSKVKLTDEQRKQIRSHYYTTTTTTTTTTTPVTCSPGHSRTPSGNCVNTQIDFNNCGLIDYVCPSNYTSCTAGRCSTRPAVQLPDAIEIFQVNRLIDDKQITVNLSVGITLYNRTSKNITITTNGIFCLNECSQAYSNGNLPNSAFNGPTVFGFWDDLALYPNTSQTVYYAINGTAPNRITTFEYYTSHLSSSQKYYHFQMIFFENRPNIVKCFYFEMSDGGESATIGVQKSSSGPVITYSVNEANAVTYNTTIVFDTNNGTWRTKL